MNKRPASVRFLAALVVMMCGACGLRVDDQPIDLPADERIDPDNAASAVAPAIGSDRIFLVGPEGPNTPAQLRAIARDSGTTPQQRIASLLKGPTAEELQAQIHTAIPIGTTVNSALINQKGRLVIDLSDQILTLSGTTLMQAVAQIVFTAYETQDVRGVVINVDGQQHDFPSGNGVLQSRPLTAYDYPGLVETSQPDFPALPSADG